MTTLQQTPSFMQQSQTPTFDKVYNSMADMGRATGSAVFYFFLVFGVLFLVGGLGLMIFGFTQKPVVIPTQYPGGPEKKVQHFGRVTGPVLMVGGLIAIGIGWLIRYLTRKYKAFAAYTTLDMITPNIF